MKFLLVLCIALIAICVVVAAPAEDEGEKCMCPCKCPARKPTVAHKEEKEEKEESEEEEETTLAPGVTHVSNGQNGATSLSTNDDAAFAQAPGGPSIFATGDGHAIIRNGNLKLIVKK